MRIKIIILLAITILTLVQVSFISALFPISTTPNIIIMFIVGATVLLGFYKVWIWVIVAGIIFDLINYSSIGTNVIVFLSIAYFSSFFSRRFLLRVKGWSVLVIVFLIFIITCISFFLSFILNLSPSLSSLISNGIFFIKNIIWTAIYNLILFSIAFYFLNKVQKFFTISEYKIDAK